jgi:hypothetical protein
MIPWLVVDAVPIWAIGVMRLGLRRRRVVAVEETWLEAVNL